MGWLKRRLDDRLDEETWPKDPALDPFRDAVWVISIEGALKGWVTTSVTPMRSIPLIWLKYESMWSQVHWVGGGHDYCQEDYAPDWFIVNELRGGSYSDWDPDGDLELVFDAEPVVGSERDRLWAELKHGAEPHDRA